MDEMEYYKQAGQAGPSTLRAVPMRVQLEEELKHHQREAERIKRLLNLLELNPAIEEFMNLQRGFMG